MAGKKNRITTITETDVQDRRIGAEGGSTIVSEGGSLTTNFADNRRNTEVFQLVDSDASIASIEALQSVSREAIGASSDTTLGLFEGASDIVGRALDLSEAAGAAQQATASAAIAKTASEGNQALETITRAAMVIAGVFFVARIFRG